MSVASYDKKGSDQGPPRRLRVMLFAVLLGVWSGPRNGGVRHVNGSPLSLPNGSDRNTAPRRVAPAWRRDQAGGRPSLRVWVLDAGIPALNRWLSRTCREARAP